MSWIELTLDTTDEAVDWVCTLLSAHHFSGDIHVSNAESENWAFTIAFFLRNQGAVGSQVDAIASILSPLQRTGITSELETYVVDEKPQPAPLSYRIGDRFVLLTLDAPFIAKSSSDLPLRIDPSLSFGSGFHPATRLSLRLLERYVKPEMQALDLGCGSGILSIAIASLGATVLALDNDAVATEAAQRMVDRNQLSDRITVKPGSLGRGSDLGHWMGGDTPNELFTLDAPKSFDLIAANILSRVQVELAGEYARSLRRTTPENGIIVAAGFTIDHEAEVVEAFTKAGFEALDCDRFNEWVALAYQLRS